MARCPHCQAELPEVGRFCATCGEALEGDSPSATRPMSPALTHKMSRGIDAPPKVEKTSDAADTLRGKKSETESGAQGGADHKDRERKRLAAVACASAAVASLVTVLIMRRHPEESVEKAPVVKQVEAPDGSSSITAAGSDETVTRRSRATRPMGAQSQANKRVAIVPEGAPEGSPAAAAQAPTAEARRTTTAGRSPYDEIMGAPPTGNATAKPNAAALGATSPNAVAPSPNAAPATKAGEAPAAPNKAAPPASLFLGDTGSEEAPLTVEDRAEQQSAETFARGIRYVMKTHQTQVRTCYERAFKGEDASPGGRVEVAFTIDKDGLVKNVKALDNSTGKEALAHCIESRLAEWHFPKPPSGEFQASYPFIFTAGTR